MAPSLTDCRNAPEIVAQLLGGSLGKIESARHTVATTLTTQKPGEHVVMVQLLGGATPGSLSIRYNGTAVAVLPVPGPSAGAIADVIYALDWVLPGTSTSSGLFTFNGGLAAVIWYIAEKPLAGALPIKAFRAERAARTTTGTSTITFSEGPAIPAGLVVLQSVNNGRAAFPADGPFNLTVEASQNVVPPLVFPTNDYTMPTNTVIVTQTLDGAGTQEIVVYY